VRLVQGRIATLLVRSAEPAACETVIDVLLDSLPPHALVSRFQRLPDTGEILLCGLLDQYGIEPPEASEAELRRIFEVFAEHQVGHGRVLYLSLAWRGARDEAVLDTVNWLSRLRYRAAPLVRLVLSCDAGTSPECLSSDGLGDEGRPFVIREVEGFDATGTRNYVWQRLRLAGAADPAALMPAEVCARLYGYTGGLASRIDELARTTLTTLAADATGAGRLVVTTTQVDAAAAELGLELRPEPEHPPTAAEGEEADRPPVLEVTSGGQEVMRYALDRPRMVLGRDSECDIHLDNRFVSRFQCLFMRVKRGWIMLDLGSTNGTFVNGRRIREHRLRDGDIVAMGKFQIRIRFPGEPAESDAGGEFFETDVLPQELYLGPALDSGTLTQALKRSQSS
jgi:hypothetical protein